MEFGRLVTAMATPFDATGAVDDEGLQRLVNHLLGTGTTALVVLGTTGESPTLSHDEKLRLIERTLMYVDGRVPVLAGTGSNDTAASVTLSREAEALGVQGLLVVSPYYNRPTQEGLRTHFLRIADAVSVPIMLYNVPNRTSVNIAAETVLRLAEEVPHIVAVKEASGDFDQIGAITAGKADDFAVYSGDDKLTLPIMALGGYGVVSVASHVVGPELRAMMQAFVEGNHRTAATWHGRLLPLFDALFRVTSPAPLKAALAMMGLISGQLRLPLVEAPDDVQAELRQQLVRLNKLQ
ncbi:MAG: 4-hydroxy-tetrahydrodipicolinate synthase [Alicyclobacillus sp.]|nr:4-hydroxy-tetrahydrodipicolinate synthase [Alicyclobacillus sp.]